jgi:hypothetical protein
MDENYLINWARYFFKHEETVTKKVIQSWKVLINEHERDSKMNGQE